MFISSVSIAGFTTQAPAGNLKKSHEHTGGGTEQRYAMIEELSVQFGVEQCCVALSVSRSGYYQWAGTEQSLQCGRQTPNC